ncbi:nucleotide sugar dehydrogenase [Clostridium novyi]
MTRKICVVGLGYIGLPTAAMFASCGYNVIGIDINNKVVNALNEGKIIIEEPGLEELVKKVVENGKLMAQLEPCEADAFIISVPTPITKEKKANMEYVEDATRSIMPYLKRGNIVILESTSPTGTTEGLMKSILNESGLVLGKDIYLGHSPERVLPGQILNELINNNRIIGGINRESAEKIRDLYSSFVKGDMFLTTATTAEMCKMMENTYRDVNIALANELAKICEEIGINAWEVIELCNKHPRVNLHQPGPGVGGHCLAVDPWFIVERVPELSNIIGLSRKTNDLMPNHVVNRIKKLLNDNDGNKKITILGITYKPNIDDLRESPILKIIDLLEAEGYEISVVDPYVKECKYLQENLIEACKDSHLILLGVNHRQFKELPLKDIEKVMKGNIIFDTRNYLDEKVINKNNFKYVLLGNNDVTDIQVSKEEVAAEKYLEK